MISLDIDFSDFGFPTVSFDDIPSADDFMKELEEDKGGSISEEEKQKLYQEFLEKQAQEQAVEIEITSEKQIEQAQKKLKSEAEPPKKYYKCVCEKCGHVMFVDAATLWSYENGLDK